MSIDSNINSNVNADPGNVGSSGQQVGVGGVQAPQGGAPVVDPSTVSSIGPSQASPPNTIYSANDPKLQQAILTLVLSEMTSMTQFNLVASFNTSSLLNNLIESGSKIGGGSLAMQTINEMSKIVTNMWEGFMQGIRETNERRDAERKSPAYLDFIDSQRPEDQKFNTNSSASQFALYVNSLPPESAERALVGLQRMEQADAWMGRNEAAIMAFANSSPGPIGNQDNLTSITVSSLVIGSPLIVDYLRVSDDPSTNFVAVKVIQDGFSALPAPIAQTIPPDLGVFGALLVNGMINKAVIDNTVVSISNGQKPTDRKTAENYADRMIGLVTGQAINNYITALVTHNMEQTDPGAQEKILEWSTAFKVILLCSALALLYKSETQHITDIEFEGMVNTAGKRDPVTNELRPDIKVAEDSLEKEILDLIEEQLARTKPRLKKEMMAALFDYINSNPSTGELMNPQMVLAKALGGMGGMSAIGGVQAATAA